MSVQLALAKDQAYRAGHLPVSTGSLTGRNTYVCAHCGAGIQVDGSRKPKGTMASLASRCFP